MGPFGVIGGGASAAAPAAGVAGAATGGGGHPKFGSPIFQKLFEAIQAKRAAQPPMQPQADPAAAAQLQARFPNGLPARAGGPGPATPGLMSAVSRQLPGTPGGPLPEHAMAYDATAKFRLGDMFGGPMRQMHNTPKQNVAEETVMLIAPDGEQRAVPSSHAPHYMRLGARRAQ